jgi:hypothetical protein
MTHVLPSSAASPSPAPGFDPLANVPARDLFEERFRRALTQCVQRGFHVEECFGAIWEETLEEVELSFREQNELYPDLIDWARRWKR